MTQLFKNAVQSGQDRPAMFIERNDAKIMWTWNQYYQDSLKFAKSCHQL